MSDALRPSDVVQMRVLYRPPGYDAVEVRTGLPFDVTGPVVVPGALVPVHCDVDQDHAVYVEPNVWVHHRI